MKCFLLILLGLFTFNSFAKDNASENEVQKNIEAAKTYMQTALRIKDLNLSNLSPQQLSLFKKYKTQFIKELSSLKIEMQNEDDQSSFIHFGQETWIETDIAPYGKIRINNIESVKKFNNFGPQLFIRFLGHEIGHHLISTESSEVTTETESLAWQISTVFETVIASQAKAPQLFKVALTNFNETKEGCHDRMNVKDVDPFTGLLRVQFTSSNEHCRIHKKYMDYLYGKGSWPFSKKMEERYVFDNLDLTLKCEPIGNGDIQCADTKAPEFIKKTCNSFLKHIVQSNIVDKYTSKMIIRKNNSVETKLAWCVLDAPKMAGFHYEEKRYATSYVSAPLSEEERNHNLSLHDSYENILFTLKVDMYGFTERDLQFKED